MATLQTFQIYQDSGRHINSKSADLLIDEEYSDEFDRSCESQLFNNDNLLVSPTSTLSPLRDSNIKNLKSKISNLSNTSYNSLSDLTNVTNVSNSRKTSFSNRSSLTVDQKRNLIFDKLNKRNSINNTNPYFYQYRSSTISKPLVSHPTILPIIPDQNEKQEIYFHNQNYPMNIPLSLLSPISPSEETLRFSNDMYDTSDKIGNDSNIEESYDESYNDTNNTTNSNGTNNYSGSNDYNNNSNGGSSDDTNNDTHNNSNNDSNTTSKTKSTADITTSSEETSMHIRNLQRNSFGLFNESNLSVLANTSKSQHVATKSKSQASRLSDATVNTIDFLQSEGVTAREKSMYSIDAIPEHPVLTIRNFTNPNTANSGINNNIDDLNRKRDLDLRIGNDSSVSVIPVKRMAGVPALVDITSGSDDTEEAYISMGSREELMPKENILPEKSGLDLESTVGFETTVQTGKTCDRLILWTLLVLSLLAPPFYLVIAAGFLDTVFGRIERKYKLASLVMFFVVVGVGIGLSVGLGVGT